MHKRHFLLFGCCVWSGLNLQEPVQEAGFYPGEHIAVATSPSPKGKVCLPKLAWKG